MSVDAALLNEINAIANRAALDHIVNIDILTHAAVLHEHFPDCTEESIIELFRTALQGR